MEAVRWRRMYGTGFSESICPTCIYGRCQDEDGCTVLFFQKTFASLVNMDAVRMKTDIQYWPF
jgi:Cys-tRNA synthase (O-phospho-L-seryl-tRNA:Cys-tRNA synthase)